MIGLVAVTRAGQRHADQLAAAWPDARVYTGPAAQALPIAFAECDGVVAFLATGAVVRILAPLLADKTAEPGVVCVDEAAQYAVAVLGGHEGGANALARRTAELLGCQPVVTTASDVIGRTIVDRIVESVDGVIDPTSDTAAVLRALVDGEHVELCLDDPWPLPPLPDNVVPVYLPDAPCIVISDRISADVPRPAIVIRPRSLAVGLGASRGVTAAEVRSLVAEVLAAHGLSPLSLRDAGSIDVKREEVGLLEAIVAEGWQAHWFTSEQLAEVEVPTPSSVVEATVGTPSVSEAAAILTAGAGQLVATKHKSAMATVAVARRRARGRLAIIGLGPGARDLVTPRAIAELQRASIVVGLDQYVDQVRDLIRPGTQLLVSELGDEETRARSAVAQAVAGEAVALIGSGDAGVYAMASPALEYAGDDIDVVVVPGVTAMLAAAADIGGAPIGHDHCAISLSDLHTPWDVIERRIRAAAEGDFVVGFYNPRSAKRDWQLPKALGILGEHRPGSTPVAVVTNASRPSAAVIQTTLADIDVEAVGMYSLVLVGSSQSRYVAGRFVTPRGYTWAG